jgi:hypothetical protein
MGKRVVNFLDQSIEITVWLVTHLGKQVIDFLLEAVFKLSCGCRRRINVKLAVGQHLRVPMLTGTVRIIHLAVSKANIFL